MHCHILCTCFPFLFSHIKFNIPQWHQSMFVFHLTEHYVLKFLIKIRFASSSGKFRPFNLQVILCESRALSTCHCMWGAWPGSVAPPILRWMTGTQDGCLKKKRKRKKEWMFWVMSPVSLAQYLWKGQQHSDKAAWSQTYGALHTGSNGANRGHAHTHSWNSLVLPWIVLLIGSADRWPVTMFKRKSKSSAITQPKTT